MAGEGDWLGDVLRWHGAAGVVRVPVENRYAFTDLGELEVRWELASRSGRCKVSLPPQAKREISLAPYRSRPPWPWSLDANRFGIRDFRAAKYNVYEAQLLSPDGAGIRLDSDGTAHVRACLTPNGVQFHSLLAKPPGQLAVGMSLSGRFSMRLLPQVSSPTN